MIEFVNGQHAQKKREISGKLTNRQIES